jgi:4-carboxymuconolactone decarboxylase
VRSPGHDRVAVRVFGSGGQADRVDRRLLDRRTKELLSLTVPRAPRAQIRAHVMVALEICVTPPEILEALEIALPEAGDCRFSARVRRLV